MGTPSNKQKDPSLAQHKTRQSCIRCLIVLLFPTIFLVIVAIAFITQPELWQNLPFALHNTQLQVKVLSPSNMKTDGVITTSVIQITGQTSIPSEVELLLDKLPIANENCSKRIG